jgi:hypothetical protein
MVWHRVATAWNQGCAPSVKEMSRAVRTRADPSRRQLEAPGHEKGVDLGDAMVAQEAHFPAWVERLAGLEPPAAALPTATCAVGAEAPC